MSMLLTLLVLLSPMRLPLPDAPSALLVCLRDDRGVGNPGVTLVVTDRGGRVVLARAVTDESGCATFESLPTADVRVDARGATGNGAKLHLLGDDLPGIALTLGPPPVQLDLRVEPDGLVRPDPATMIVPDVGVVVADDVPMLPTAMAPTPLPMLAGVGAVPGPGQAVSDDQPPASASLRQLLVITLIGAVTVAALLIGLRRRT